MHVADFEARSHDPSLIHDVPEMFPIEQLRGLLFAGAQALGTQEGRLCHQAPRVLLPEQDLLHLVRVTHHAGKSIKDALRSSVQWTCQFRSSTYKHQLINPKSVSAQSLYGPMYRFLGTSPPCSFQERRALRLWILSFFLTL